MEKDTAFELGCSLESTNAKIQDVQNILSLLSENLSDDTTPVGDTSEENEEITGVLLLRRMPLYFSLICTIGDMLKTAQNEISRISDIAFDRQ